MLNVQPRFTFTKIEEPIERVLDTGVEGIPYVAFNQFEPAPWVSDIEDVVGAHVDPCSDFHAGFEEELQLAACDCNGNGVRDKCDIENGDEEDCNENLVPDACDIASGVSQDEDGNGIPDECDVIGVDGAPVASRITLDVRPNPLASGTTFMYSLAHGGHTRLIVHDVQGRFVATLVDEAQAAGSHEAVWDGHDASGTPVPAGVYYATLATDGEQQASKVVVLK
jgi:hypothetical protein